MVLCYCSHVMTRLRPGEKYVISGKRVLSLLQLDHFQVLYHDNSLCNDHENNCLQWKTSWFVLSDRGEECALCEDLSNSPEVCRVHPLDSKLTDLLMWFSKKGWMLLWLAFPAATLILVALRHTQTKNGHWAKIKVSYLRGVSHWN